MSIGNHKHDFNDFDFIVLSFTSVFFYPIARGSEVEINLLPMGAG
jgi:hypothetical protein